MMVESVELKADLDNLVLSVVAESVKEELVVYQEATTVVALVAIEAAA